MTPRKDGASQILLDVGGTSTRVFLLLPNGRLKKILSRPSSLTSHSSLVRALRRHFPVLPIFAGLRGVWTASEKFKARRDLGLAGKRHRVLSDLELAHWAIFRGNPGLILSSGTGSALFGRTRAGKKIRAGGLGPFIGDEGSGFWFGRAHLLWLKKRGASFSKLRPLASGPNAARKIALHGKKVFKKGWFFKNQEGKKALKLGLRALADQADAAVSKKDRKELDMVLRGGVFKDKKVRGMMAGFLKRRGFQVSNLTAGF